MVLWSYAEIVTDNGPELRSYKETLTIYGIPTSTFRHKILSNELLNRGHVTIWGRTSKGMWGNINCWPDVVHQHSLLIESWHDKPRNFTHSIFYIGGQPCSTTALLKDDLTVPDLFPTCHHIYPHFMNQQLRKLPDNTDKAHRNTALITLEKQQHLNNDFNEELARDEYSLETVVSFENSPEWRKS